jgi:hypothetical protein
MKSTNFLLLLLVAIFNYFTASDCLAQSLSVQLSSAGVSCNGNADGTAKVVISGGLAPYTVKWFSDSTTLDSVSMNPELDNTIYEQSGSLSNGAGEYMPIGKSGNGFLHRGLVMFPVLESIPAFSVISSVVLKMNLSNTSGSSGTKVIEAHKLLQDWGEGTSDASPQAGQGSPATTNDATWTYRYFSTVSWNTPGGDFSPTVSALTTVNNPASYNWSGSGLVADVQSWVNNVSPNYGWILLGQETGTKSGKRFDTRENSIPANRPLLKVVFQKLVEISNLDSIGGLSAGTYTVVVTDAMNQDTTIVFQISEPASLSASLIVTPSSCLQANGSVNAVVSGGTQPYSYNWNNGQTSNVISQILPGNYIVQIVDSLGCSRLDSGLVSNIGLPDSVAIFDTACTSYNWYGVVLSAPGVYPKNFLNTAGCDSVIYLHLQLTYAFADTVKIDLPLNQSSLCPLGNITLKAYPQSNLFSYSWSNGTTIDSVNLTTAQLIDVTVTDQAGCSKTSVAFAVIEGYRVSDFNKDGITNTLDFLFLVSVFGQPCQNCLTDIDQSGFVDVADFLQLVSSFNLGCL